MPDIAIVNTTVTAEPKDYRLTGGQELQVKAVRAVVDGTSATTSFLPTLQLLAPDGTVMWEGFPPETVAAGASADVSWFPGLNLQTVDASPQAGVSVEVVYYDTVNAATPLTMSTTLTTGVTYLLIVEGTYSLWNSALTVGTPEANAQFPGSTAGRSSTQVGLDADTDFAVKSGSGRTVGHADLLTFSLDNGATYNHVEPEGGPYGTPQTGHLYRYVLTGQNHPLKVILNDINPPDNYGKLRFTLQLPDGTGTGSGAGSLVPAADTTNNGNVLTVTAGLPVWGNVDGGSP